MAKKTKLKKTLVEQILTKANIPHQGLQINALENETGDIDDRSQIYKTLALTGDKTGPVIGILPITEHLSEKKLAKISGNKKVAMIPQKHSYPIFIDQVALEREAIIVSAGEVGRSILIKAQELADFVKADFADIKED